MIDDEHLLISVLLYDIMSFSIVWDFPPSMDFYEYWKMLEEGRKLTAPQKNRIRNTHKLIKNLEEKNEKIKELKKQVREDMGAFEEYKKEELALIDKN